MPKIVAISSDDSKVCEKVMDYFNQLPLPSRTNSEALAIFKGFLTEYMIDRATIHKSCKHLIDQPEHTNAMVYLLEQIQLADNRDELLDGAWTQLCGALSDLLYKVTWWGSYSLDEISRNTRILAVKADLETISNAMSNPML